jgi:hypothetical protein
MNTWLILNEAHFHVSGFVNNQNCRHCSKATCRLYTMFLIYFRTLACTCWFQLSYLDTQCTVIHFKTRTKFTSIFCIFHKWQCFVQFLMALFGLCVSENAGWCTVRDYLCRSVQIHIGNIRPRQLHLLWSQQDGQTAHTARISIQVIRTFSQADSFLCFGTSPGPSARLILR